MTGRSPSTDVFQLFGRLVLEKLPDAELAKYRGLLGHFHIQENKIDPGPAFQWDALVTGARRRLELPGVIK